MSEINACPLVCSSFTASLLLKDDKVINITAIFGSDVYLAAIHIWNVLRHISTLNTDNWA